MKSYQSQSSLQGGRSGQSANVVAPQLNKISDPALKRSFKGHKDAVNSATFNPNLKQIISGSQDGTVMVWNFKALMRPYRFVGHKGPVYSVAVSNNGQSIVSSSADHTIRVWNNSVEGYSQVIKSHSAPVKTVALSSDSSLLVSGSDDKMIKVWELQDRKFMFSLAGHSNWVNSAEFSPDTRLVCSASDDRTVKIWDITNKKQTKSFNDHTQGVNSVRFHPDGTCIASGSADSTVKIWDVRSDKLIQHYEAANDSVTQIAFHPNGRFLLSSSLDSTVKIWDLRKGHILYSLYGHEGPSNTVNFSPSGDFFTSSGADSVVMCWKSNLNEIDTEQIDDLGGKSSTQNLAGKNTAAASAPSHQRQGSRGAGSARGAAPSSYRQKQGTSTMQTSPSPMKGIAKSTQKQQPIGSPSTVHQSTVKTGNIAGYGGGQSNADFNIGAGQPSGNGVTGSGEELALTLEKVVSQLDIISRTLHVLEQRVSMNENSVQVCLQYFRENREKAQEQPGPLSFNYGLLQQQDQQNQEIRGGLEQIRDITRQFKSSIPGEDSESAPASNRGLVTMGARDDLELDDQGQDDGDDLDDFKRD